jgi:hypothetical protein
MKILGAIGGIIGAIIVIIAGIDMIHIVSESGNSIMEISYHATGKGFIGLGIFCIALICVVAFRETYSTEEDEEEEDEEEDE